MTASTQPHWPHCATDGGPAHYESAVMSDAKELVERARYLCGKMINDDQWEQTVREKLSECADWIELLAPLFEAVVEAERLQRAFDAWCNNGIDEPMPNSSAERRAAKKLVQELIAAAIRKVKP